MLISKTPLLLLLYSFQIVSEQDLGSYSCVFGTEAQIDFILAGKEINNESLQDISQLHLFCYQLLKSLLKLFIVNINI